MATAAGHRMESNSGMGPRKTMIIMVTVVGCVAILWPKVFYPMMVGNGQNKNVIKDHRGAGCCGVVLDQETFANASISYASSQQAYQQQQDQQQNLFRKRNYAPYVEIDSIRQERPPHLRPETMHPAMRERGRAIPQAGAIHGGDRPQTPPRIVEGRPGPIPGMRPPMGAGSHQATKSANSMGFIMPLYTIGIVSFFIYTIMKLIFKKTPATPYAEIKPDPAFRNEVFTTEQYIKRPSDGTTKLDQSHSSTATNGELFAPSAVSSSSIDVAPVEAALVQSELTIDYEQLSMRKEAAKIDENAAPVTDKSNDESEHVAAVQEDSIEPTERVFEDHTEESINDQQPLHDPTTEKVVDGYVVQKVVSLEQSEGMPSQSAMEATINENGESQVNVNQKDEQREATTESIDGEVPLVQAEIAVEPVVEEVIVQQRASVENAAISFVSKDTQDTVHETTSPITVSDDQKIAYDEIIEQTSDTEEKLFETKQDVQNETSLENEVEDKIETSDSPRDVSPQQEEEKVAYEPNVTQVDNSDLPVVEVINGDVQDKALRENENGEVNLLRFDEVEDPMIAKAAETTEALASRVEEESVEFRLSKNDTDAIIADENITHDEGLEKDVSVEDVSSKENDQTACAEISPIESEAISQQRQESEPQHVVETNVETLRIENFAVDTVDGSELESAQTVASVKGMDAETSALVHETVEEITLTAEQLVQEVLEHAEELAKQQNEYPVLPTYDPSTQKLVDGEVVELFDNREKEEPVSAKDDDVIENDSQELLTAEEESAQGATEEDAGELDSVSEDTSLSVASVIEQQPVVKKSEESTAAVTAEAMTDSGSSDLVFVDGNDQAKEGAEAEFDAMEAVDQAGNKLGVAAAEDVNTLAKESAESATLSDALITTEVMSVGTSSEPVFLERNDQPTVETETILEGTDEVDDAGNKSGAAAAEGGDKKSVFIEEVLDETAIVDEVEGKVIEEHIVPISIEKASPPDAMTITEVTGEGLVDDPLCVSKTTSNLPSPHVSAVPVMDSIDEEKQESAEVDGGRPNVQGKQCEISPATLEHVTKEALVERTLNEAAAVVNEIESIVDHIITEKLIHSGASETLVPESAEATANDVPDPVQQEPPRLAASAALIVEAIESKTSVVHGMVPSRDSTEHTQITAVTNGLITNLDSTIGDTNPSASDPPPTGSPLLAPASLPSSDAFPVPATPQSSSSDLPVSSAPVPVSASEIHGVNLVADGAPPSSAVVSSTQGASEPVVGNGLHEQGSPAGELRGAATSTIGQVPTSVSNVTNPKFLTLNLANYSTSDSSGNNSKSSSFSIANLSQSGASLAGGDSADQLMELELLRKKLDETERAMTKIIANMGTIPKGQESNVSADTTDTVTNDAGTESTATGEEPEKIANGHAVTPADTTADGEPSEKSATGEESSSAASTPDKKPKKRDTSTERGTVKVMAMEVTAQRENGKRLSRPSTPLLPIGGHPETANVPSEEQETRSIVLDGRLPHDSKILVSDSETAVEKLEPENSEEEDDAPVILSGKMTLSLINMDFIEKDATGTVAVGEIVTELHKPQEELTTAPSKNNE